MAGIGKYADNLTAQGVSEALVEFQPKLQALLQKAGTVMLGKDRELKLALCCLLAGGHLLLEDIPGMGKTTMVKLLSKLLGLQMSRIQFTNDLLPADILGISIFNETQRQFMFHPGPMFAQLVMADELNRASPRTQSACLQAMEEQEVTVDGVTHPLPKPFFLIATQNPRQSIGTFPLPGSQLDRFLMRIQLGYPSREAEKDLLLGTKRSTLLDTLDPVLSADEVKRIQAWIEAVHAAPSIVDYILELVRQSREEEQGLSPRAGINLLEAARCWAFLEGRTFVLPEDVQAVAVPVISHRLEPEGYGLDGVALAQSLLNRVAVD